MKLHNSLSRRTEEFKPLLPNKVTIYVCGITPYDTTHLGHAFTYLSFDVLIRFLLFRGFNVEYTQNVTDINDRDKDILQRAKEEHVSWQKLANIWTRRFLSDMKALNWIQPTHYLYASNEIPPMIYLIQKLLDKGLAYQIGGSVYLDVKMFPDYGKLSHLKYDQMLELAKDFDEDIDNPNKKNPLDITLWKGAAPNQEAHIPSFDSPFGKGRPGWHIECSAMSIYSLGVKIDIHGGGEDLIYPHHEAEIVQSEGATGKKPFAKYWLHVATVSHKGRKMSKSLGNLILVSDLLKRYSPNAVRWTLLSHHYRKPWGFNEKELKESERTIKSIKFGKGDIPNELIKALENNLDTPRALEIIKKTGSARAFELLGFTSS